MSNNTKFLRASQLIKKSCEDCGGDGCRICNNKISKIQKYHDSNIPSSFWIKSFKEYSGDDEYAEFIRDKIHNIDRVFDGGESFILAGNLGVGKTYGICSILKMAVSKDYDVKYFSMAEIINRILSKSINDELQNLCDIDFLAIDEFDNRWIFPSEKSEQLFGSSMEYLLRTRFQAMLPTLLATNNSDLDQILSGSYGRSFSSLRSQYLKTMFVSGRDFRKKMSKDK
jgi:DNA replication protein DnaC